MTSSETTTTAPAVVDKKPGPLKIDDSQVNDFDGEINTNNTLPTAEDLSKVENYYVLDRNGKTHRFKELYSGKNVARRVLIIFIRHFFCGNCQLYVQDVSEQITPESLLRLPISTSIAIIGCGDPRLIDMYAKETNCEFPIYTDPERRIFDALGMVSTLNLGQRPKYAKKSLGKVILDSMVLSLTKLHNGLAFQGGPVKQVGGEFLFEPLDIASPLGTPYELGKSARGFGADGVPEEVVEDIMVEPKRVTWCHRMRSTRDHVEIPELKEVLGLVKADATASTERKGSGTTMAGVMSRMSEMNGRLDTP